MELKCPHCGKTQSLSLHSLQASGGMVICPQCVSEFYVSLKQVPQEAIEQTQLSETPRSNAENQNFTFCPTCGKHLPAHGLNFCPYCGSSLSFTPAPDPQPATPAPEATPAATPAAASHTTEKAIAELPFVHIPLYSAKPMEKVSLRFKITAWAVIAILVAIFITMVYLGNID